LHPGIIKWKLFKDERFLKPWLISRMPASDICLEKLNPRVTFWREEMFSKIFLM